MANVFIEYIQTKIKEDNSLLLPANAGTRSRIFDNFRSTPEQFGTEAREFLRQADALYKERIFIPPFTQRNVDFTHNLFMRLNKDMNQTEEWDDFWKGLTTEHPTLTVDEIANLKLQFLSAYRFKVITFFNTLLQQYHADEKLIIIAREGYFLQTLNRLIKNEGKKRHLTNEELLNSVTDDLRGDLKASLGNEENFCTFYTPKNAKAISNLGIEGFRIIFEHFNKDNTSLTHKMADYAKSNSIRDFLRSFQSAIKENPAFDDFIKNDPDALFFLYNANKTIKKDNNAEDKPLHKLLESLISAAPANPKNLLAALKQIEKKLENGELRSKLSALIKQVETNDNFPDVSYSVMIEILKNLKVLKGHATLAYFVINLPIVQKLIQLCDTFIGTKKLVAAVPAPTALASGEPIPQASLAEAAVALLPEPVVFNVRQALSSSSSISQQDPIKEKLVDMLKTKANELRSIQDNSQKEPTPQELHIAGLISDAADSLLNARAPPDIEEIIANLKGEILKIVSTIAGVSKDSRLDNLNEEIDLIYKQFQDEKLQSPPKL